jgi:hypothetical protein
MPPARIKGRAVVGVGADERADFLLVDVADLRIAVRLLQMRHIAPRSARIARLMVRVQQARAVVTLDAEGFNERVQVLARPERKVPEPVSITDTELALEPVLIAPQAHMHLPAIAPGRAPSEARLLQEFDREAATRQVQRGRAPRKAAPDNADIAAMRTLKRRSDSGVRHGRRIVRRRVQGARSERVDRVTAWHGTGVRREAAGLRSCRAKSVITDCKCENTPRCKPPPSS